MPSCLAPLSLRNPPRTVPCGKCPYCLSNKRHDWIFRLNLEQKHSVSSIFVTLTIAPQYLSWRNGIAQLQKSDFQKFIKRIRQEQEKYSTLQVRYYGVGEYGTKTGRPHYHALIFNLHEKVDIKKFWYHGHVHIGEVTQSSVAYCTKYVIQYKDASQKNINPPFAVMSKRPAIGHQYLTATMKKWHKDNQYFHVMDHEQKLNMPRYYRKKIFTDRELKLNQIRTQFESFDNYRKILLNLAKRGQRNPIQYYHEMRLHNAKRIKQKVYHTQTI